MYMRSRVATVIFLMVGSQPEKDAAQKGRRNGARALNKRLTEFVYLQDLFIWGANEFPLMFIPF